MSLLACGDAGGGLPIALDASTPLRPPVLTFDPSMLERDGGVPAVHPVLDGSQPLPDGGEPSEEDAGGEPVEPTLFEGTEPTNTPNASVKYGGSEANPGLALLGSHLELPEISGTSTEWLGRMRNDFSDTICAFVLTVRFLGASNNLLFELTALADLRPHSDASSVADCAGPGEVFYLHASDAVSGAAGITLDDVYTVQWRYKSAGYLDTRSPSQLASLSALTVDTVDGGFGYGLHGVVTNSGSTVLQSPSVIAYLLNAGGQPLARISASSFSPIGAFGSWSFVAKRYPHPFPLSSVDTVVGYSVY